MTPEEWDRVKSIFSEAMDLAAQDRPAFIAQACGENSEVRQEVEVLVQKAESTDTFLEDGHRERILPKASSYAPLFAAGDVLCGRYKVLRFIANGGMGEVYEVKDAELRAKVALKTVSLTIASDPHHLGRFKQEVHLARQVTHRNVCRVFDVGHHKHPLHGDITFLTMELLQGETLAARLDREGPLTCERALPLIDQMVSGLSAAHDLGIIHRDFKPGNVMLLHETSPTTLKVTDFGLARSLDSDETLTSRRGEIVGTPDFMAPEQFSGLSSVETDVYALGVVIYVMLAAKLPASRTTPFARDSESAADGMRVDPMWQSAIERCLATDPHARFHSVQEVWRCLSGDDTHRAGGLPKLAAAIKRYPRILASVLFLAVAYGALVWSSILPNPINRLPEQKHIAVLPFQNIGNDAANQAFTEGIVESLTSNLSQLERFQKSFWIVPSGDARKVKSLDDAYRNFNITLAVSGSVQHTDKGIILTTNLVDAKDHKQLASRTIRTTSGDLDRLQGRVWEAVAEMVDLQISPEIARKVGAGETRQPGAYELYEQGVGYAARRDADSLDRAIELFNNALVKDPGYALAYAGLGAAYASKYGLTRDTQWIEKAISNGQRALELDDRVVPVHLAMGKIYQETGELDKALAEFRTALDEDPISIEAAYSTAVIYITQGKTTEAEATFKDIIDRRPGYWPAYSGLGTLYSSQGKFTLAIAQFQTMIDLQPDNSVGYNDLGGAYIGLGHFENAVSVLEKGLRLKETAPAWTNLGAAYMYLKRYREAADAMRKATELDPHNDVMWRNLGDSYRQIPGNSAEASQAYERALDAAQAELKVNPNNTEVISGAALYYAHLGAKSEAESFIRQALKLSPNDSDILFTSALVYEIIGHRDKALIAIDKAVKAGYSINDLEEEPELRNLRSDPRYQNWLRSRSVRNDSS